MTPIIILLIAGSIEGAFVGADALGACLDTAVTYEEPGACVTATSEVRPHLGLRLIENVRPMKRPPMVCPTADDCRFVEPTK